MKPIKKRELKGTMPVHVKRSIWKKIKVRAAEEERDMGEVASELMEKALEVK